MASLSSCHVWRGRRNTEGTEGPFSLSPSFRAALLQHPAVLPGPGGFATSLWPHQQCFQSITPNLPQCPMCTSPRAAIVEVNYHCTTPCCWHILELGILGGWIYFMPSCFVCLQLMHFTGKLSSQVKEPGRFGPPKGWSCSPESVTGTSHLNSERSMLDLAMWFHSVPLKAAWKPSPKMYLLYKTEDEKNQQNMVKK